VFSVLTSILSQYRDKRFCSKDCDSFNLGRLIINLCELKLENPPETPFPGISVQKLLGDLRGMDLLHSYRKECKATSGKPLGVDDHIPGRIRKELKRLESEIIGLDL
jgi:hypothetical protein